MPKATRESYTKSQRDEVAKMYVDGRSLSEIAARTKIGHGSLYRMLHKSKVPLRGRTPAAKPAPSAPAAKAAPEVETPEVALPKSRKEGALKAKLKDALEMNSKLKSLIVEMMLDKKR